MEDRKTTPWERTASTAIIEAAKLEHSREDIIKLYVSGVTFITKKATILKYPNTKLGRLVEMKHTQTEFYFDTDERAFREVLHFYRTGKLHTPRDMCAETFQEHLQYWEIDEKRLSSCCNETTAEDEIMEQQFQRFERRVEICDQSPMTAGHYIWYFLTDPFGPYTKNTKLSLAWKVFYLTMVSVQAIVFAVMTMAEEYGRFVESEDVVSAKDFLSALFKTPCEAMRSGINNIGPNRRVALYFPFFFGIEVLVRFICSPCKKWFAHSINMVDMLVSIVEVPCSVTLVAYQLGAPLPRHPASCLIANSVPYFLTYTAAQYRTLRLLGFVSLFSSMQVLALALYASIREIGLLIATLVISTFLGGFGIYWAETIGYYLLHETVTPIISSLPKGYWWTVVTMTTVGYGDFYPTNWFGYGFAVLIMLAGLMLTSLPIAIIGGNFAVYHEYNQKRQQRLKKQKQQVKARMTGKVDTETPLTNGFEFSNSSST